MLAINVSPNSCHSLEFGFVGAQPEDRLGKSDKYKPHSSGEHHLGETGKESSSDEECVKKTHLLLREVHKAIFNEQVGLFFYYCCSSWFSVSNLSNFITLNIFLIVYCFGTSASRCLIW